MELVPIDANGYLTLVLSRWLFEARRAASVGPGIATSLVEHTIRPQFGVHRISLRIEFRFRYIG